MYQKRNYDFIKSRIDKRSSMYTIPAQPNKATYEDLDRNYKTMFRLEKQKLRPSKNDSESKK